MWSEEKSEWSQNTNLRCLGSRNITHTLFRWDLDVSDRIPNFHTEKGFGVGKSNFCGKMKRLEEEIVVINEIPAQGTRISDLTVREISPLSATNRSLYTPERDKQASRKTTSPWCFDISRSISLRGSDNVDLSRNGCWERFWEISRYVSIFYAKMKIFLFFFVFFYDFFFNIFRAKS